jgi:hypothetical protein
VRIPANERRGHARTRYTAEEIICHLRTVEIEAGKGIGIADACRQLDITELTYYRWKNTAACASSRPNG